MKITRVFLSLFFLSTANTSYTVQDSSPHVVIQMSKQKNDIRSDDNQSCNTRFLLYNMTGLALGTTAYIISSTFTGNIASQIIATISLGTLPTLTGTAYELYTCYKKR